MLLVSPADEHESPPCDAQPDELDIAYASEFAMQALDGLINQAYRPQLGWFEDICAGQHTHCWLRSHSAWFFLVCRTRWTWDSNCAGHGTTRSGADSWR